MSEPTSPSQFVAISTDYKNLKKEGPDFWTPQQGSLAQMGICNPSVIPDWILQTHAVWFYEP